MGKKTYFASDFHLGDGNHDANIAKEKKVVAWLKSIQEKAAAVYLLGDIFDFWHEYKTVIPKGFTRFLGQLAVLRDNDIPVYFFTGNHDLWMTNYFQKELDIIVFKNVKEVQIGSKNFVIGHGDGLGDGDEFFKKLHKLFHNKTAQWLFRWIHPDIGMRLAHYWSRKSSEKSMDKTGFVSAEEERLFMYCRKWVKQRHVDYFVFGHRHLPLNLAVSDNSRYINTGDWITHNSYAVFDGKKMELKTFTNEIV